MESWRIAAAAANLLLVAGYAIGSWLTVDNSGWYNSLRRPSWQPPDWVFGVAWPYHFTILTISLWQVSNQLDLGRVLLATGCFAASVVAALLWSYVFYRRRRLALSAVWLGVTNLFTPPILWAVFATSPTLGWLLVPYQVWLAVAFSLAAGYATLNRNSV